jgi:hypothetical protein
MFDMNRKLTSVYINKRIIMICLKTREIKWLNVEKKLKRKLKRKKLRKEEKKDSLLFN